jgi:hypothetical protein
VYFKVMSQGRFIPEIFRNAFGKVSRFVQICLCRRWVRLRSIRASLRASELKRDELEVDRRLHLVVPCLDTP